MSKNFLKKESVYIGNKKNTYIFIFIIFVLMILTSYIFMIYINKSVIDNSKNVHYINLELNEKIKSLKKNLKESNLEIIEYKRDNQELSSIFNKYTDVIKFKLATSEEIKNSLFLKDEEILRLNKEINYFKFLSNSKNKSNLVSIENFQIKLDEKNNIIAYSALLLSTDNKSRIRGTFKFYYDGFAKSTNNKILKNSINIDNKNFNFKNYQILSGEISLPEDHAIKVLYLDVKCNGKIYNYKHEFF